MRYQKRIKGLKYDLGTDYCNMKNFRATETAMNFVMIGYNLVSLFRQVVLGVRVQPILKTIPHKVFAVGGYVTREVNTHILKLSMAMQRREWFSGLWAVLKSFDLPATFSAHS